jgi:hypothetical protein
MEARVQNSEEKRKLAPSFDFKRKSEVLREIAERRKSVRLSHHFSAKLSKVGLHLPVNGVTENVSPGGAFIKTKDWREFRFHDQIVVTLFIPPTFSGQVKNIGLKGSAVVLRRVEKNDGVAVQFSTPFRQFERLSG